MSRRVVLAHCWTGHPEFAWYPYLKRALEPHGFRVLIPALPHPDLPDPDEWREALTETIGTPGKNLTLIGHSLGCATILQYLQTTPQPVGNVILVACGTDSLGHAEIEPFYASSLDFMKIQQNAKSFTAFYSDDDPLLASDTFRHAALIFKRLWADIIVQPERGHFTGVEFPELVTTVLKLVYGGQKRARK